MNELDNFKTNLTSENKTIFGVVGIVIGILCWGLGHPGIGIMDVVILIFPAILLVIPNETIRNSKILGIIAAIIIGFLLIFGLYSLMIVVTQYLPDSWAFTPGYVEGMLLSDILQVILAIYGLFCAFLLTIPTKLTQTGVLPAVTKRSISCSSCGAQLNDSAKFCHMCGAKVEEAVENEFNFCPECGSEIEDDARFCQQCGLNLFEEEISGEVKETSENEKQGGELTTGEE